MKFNLKYSLLAAAAFCSAALVSCSDDDNGGNEDLQNSVTLDIARANLEYNADNIWAGWDVDEPLAIQGFEFSHSIGDYGTTHGFTAARITDTEFDPPMYLHQFEVITGGGVDGPGTPYIVGNWDTFSEAPEPEFADRTCSIVYTDGEEEDIFPFYPQSVYVTNTCYSYYSMLYGDDYAKKFNFDEKDYFIVEFHGVHTDGSESQINVYLADPDKREIVNYWKKVDLSPLGRVAGIYLTFRSSDNSDYGMNTPAYVALDKLSIIPDKK